MILVDVNKHYTCYFCEEEIEFSLPTNEVIRSLLANGHTPKAEWRHTDTKEVVCCTKATPGSFEIEF